MLDEKMILPCFLQTKHGEVTIKAVRNVIREQAEIFREKMSKTIKKYTMYCNTIFSEYYFITDRFNFVLVFQFDDDEEMILELYFTSSFLFLDFNKILAILTLIGEEVNNKDDIKDVDTKEIKRILEKLLDEDQFKLKL